MNSTAAVQTEPLPGYLITERIGSGGYGEVFKAVAPGGIDKAVKSLYGYHDEELASRELKALERIKQLRHPFLLSLDRFEVVDGRLIVVTELADGSLDDCFQEHRRDGRPGIPRDELLGYLRDAADALDYMQQQHGLQHLDVKPENLLVVGGHVKVADFGLVKDVARASQKSMMGGMTPTYAAPELFDNSPGARSDQYGLAIVYQEMLTGTLPFPGRTAAQLVAQHTQAAPRVAPLPELDQPAIERALAKNPEDRFSSCMALVDALVGAGGPPPERAATGSPAPWSPPLAAGDDTKGASSHVTERIPAEGLADPHPSSDSPGIDETAAAAGRRWAATEQVSQGSDAWIAAATRDSEPRAPRRVEPDVPEVKVSGKVVDGDFPDVDDIAPAIRPTLLVGVGGQGAAVLKRVRAQLSESRPEVDWTRLAPMLVLDTDRTAIRAFDMKVAVDETDQGIETCVMPLKLPQHYRNRSSNILQWLSRRWFYNIPRSLETGGFRPLGRLALIDNAQAVLRAIHKSLARISQGEELERASANLNCQIDAPRVILIASTSGGTGSGMAVDLAWALRNALADDQRFSFELTALFGDCHGAGADDRDLALVNTLAFLREYSSIARQGNRSRNQWHEQTALFEGPGSPLDHAYFLSADRGDARLSVEQWVDQTTQYLTAQVASGCGPFLEACRDMPPADSQTVEAGDRLRSFALVALDQQQQAIARMATQKLTSLAGRMWQLPGNVESIAPPQPPGGFRTSLFKRGKRAAAEAAQREAAITRLRHNIVDHFGAAGHSEFACELGAHLGEHLAAIDELYSTGDKNAQRDPLHELCRYACEELAKVACARSDDANDNEAVSARCVKTGDGETREDIETEVGQDVAALAAEVARKAGKNYFTALAVGRKPWVLDLGKSLSQVVEWTLDQLQQDPAGQRLVEQLADCKPDLRLLLEQAGIGPPGCGHRRCALVILPEAAVTDELEAELRSVVPKAKIVRGKVEQPLLIHEVDGLSLAQVAGTLYADRPDLVEASRRLQTRNDVAWLPLPQVVNADSD